MTGGFYGEMVFRVRKGGLTLILVVRWCVGAKRWGYLVILVGLMMGLWELVMEGGSRRKSSPPGKQALT